VTTQTILDPVLNGAVENSVFEDPVENNALPEPETNTEPDTELRETDHNDDSVAEVEKAVPAMSEADMTDTQAADNVVSECLPARDHTSTH
jgi:hypothetical protein